MLFVIWHDLHVCTKETNIIIIIVIVIVIILIIILVIIIIIHHHHHRRRRHHHRRRRHHQHHHHHPHHHVCNCSYFGSIVIHVSHNHSFRIIRYSCLTFARSSDVDSTP